MNIGFIGAGKVGCSLGKYFAEAGSKIEGGKTAAEPAPQVTVKGYYSRSRSSAQEAAHFTNTKYYENVNDLIKACDVIFLTVPDGSIQEAWNQVKQYDIKEKTICHCSGAMSSKDAFEGIEETGAYGYTVHPLFAVSDRFTAYRELSGVFFTLESGELVKRQVFQKRPPAPLQAFLESIGNPTQLIAAEDKIMYHCAAALASNLVCGLVSQSVELMTGCGFTEQDAIKALAPILIGNMEHISEKGPVASLTGPVERNDIQTVQKHLDCLKSLEPSGEEYGEIYEVYRLLSGRLIKMAQRRHPDRNYSQMMQLIDRKGTRQ